MADPAPVMTPLFVAAVLVWVVVWAVAVTRLHLWREIHHFYLGAAVLLLAGNTPLGFVGLWIMADDGYQHVCQLTDPSYRSPLHRVYQYVCGPTHVRVAAWWTSYRSR